MTGNGTRGLMISGALLGAIRTESSLPVDFRVLVYPDGRQEAQGAYPWTEGMRSGVTWKDLPKVMVDITGNPLPVDEGDDLRNYRYGGTD